MILIGSFDEDLTGCRHSALGSGAISATVCDRGPVVFIHREKDARRVGCIRGAATHRSSYSVASDQSSVEPYNDEPDEPSSSTSSLDDDESTVESKICRLLWALLLPFLRFWSAFHIGSAW